MAITDYFVRYLQQRDALSEKDIERLRAIPTVHVSFEPEEIIVPRGVSVTRSCIMLRGMSARQHVLRHNSGQRVISALHVPGDFLDLHSFVLSGLEHDIVSIGHSDVEFVDHTELREITRNYPHLTRLLWMSTVIDAAIHRQWLVASTSLRSSAHLAHLICEIYVRLANVGAAENYVFQFPARQKDLADILGYSTVHVNRAVRHLRETGLINWNGQIVKILNWPALIKLARFFPDYLELEKARR